MSCELRVASCELRVCHGEREEKILATATTTTSTTTGEE